MLRPFERFVGQGAGVHHEKLIYAEVGHRPRHRSDVAIVHGRYQYHSVGGHVGGLKSAFVLNAAVVWHAAVKMAYDGRMFMGSQRQPGVRTVESETIAALQVIGAMESAASSRFLFASRTDRGVSALGNVVSFTTSFERPALLKALNAASEDVMFYAVAEVPDNFSPRRAKARWYRYLLPLDRIDARAATACAQLFVGRHDFSRLLQT